MNKILLSSALIAAFAVSGVAGEHEWELNGVLKNETSVYTSAANTLRNSGSHSSGELMKMENSINLFINGELTDKTALHIQGNLIHDNEGVEDFRGHRAYTQHDYLREFYIDTSIEDSAIGSWDFRIGKQQVVWGTADGVKFLDIINPTDWREWGQNTMEDSRIPLWMVTAETSIGDDSSLQLVWVPDIQINQISGLINPNRSGDAGQPFVSLGADTLTGRYNGFLNIAPDLGKTAVIFQNLLGMGGLNGLTGAMGGLTVEGFTSLSNGDGTVGPATNFATLAAGAAADPTVDQALLNSVFMPLAQNYGSGNAMLNAAANNAEGLFGSFASYMTGFGPNASTALAGFAGAPDANKVAGLAAQGFTQLDATSLLSAVRTNMNNFNFTDNSVKALVGLGTQLLAPYAGATTGDDAFKAGMLTQFQGFSQALAGIEAAVAAGDQATQGAIATQMLTGSFGLTTAEAGALLTQTADAATLAKYSAGVDAFLANGLGSMVDPMLALAPSFTSGTTNELESGTLSVSNPKSMFDYMGATTFATFSDFQGMTSTYRQDHENSTFQNHNLGLRFKSTAFDSLNYSLNYYYHWENNPYVDMQWEDNKGNKLVAAEVATPAQTAGGIVNMTSIALQNLDGTNFDATRDATGAWATTANAVFTEHMNRVHSIGTSMDYAIETPIAPMVLRGEFLYDKDSMTTVLDFGKLAIGDLSGAIKPTKADFFKYVLGADITLFTNLFVSAQYMETRNLDYVDQAGSSYANHGGRSYGMYTVNSATMHLSNGLKKAEEVQRMYTLFLSKPFLESDALRVNNITLLEGEDSGIWNRLDAEYTYSDEILLTAEYNYYGGDVNGIFGQFEDSSSVQVGFKYIF